MRFLILNTRVPFIRGGAELMEKGLIKAICKSGHNVDIIRLLENWSSLDYLLKIMLEARMIDIENLPVRPDTVIALKFPSYFVKHNNKIVWFLHHYRQFYDLWDSPFSMPHTEETMAYRDTIIQADTKMLKEARKVFAISKTVAKRLEIYNGIQADILYPPLENRESFKCESYEKFFLFPSRLSAIKRHELAIKAMKYLNSSINLIIAGRVENFQYLKKLEELIDNLELRDRVKILKNLSQDDLIDLYSKCLAVIFPSYNEDYGYVTLEAMYSGKAVITCHDSGGPIEFIEDGINGFITAPDPTFLADAMDKLSNTEIAEKLGKSGYDIISNLDLSWDKVIETLLNYA